MALDPNDEARLRLVENTLLLMPTTLAQHRSELLTSQERIRGELKDIHDELANIDGSVARVTLWETDHRKEHNADEIERKVKAAVLQGAQEARDSFWNGIGLVPKVVAGIVVVTGPLGWIGALIYMAAK